MTDFMKPNTLHKRYQGLTLVELLVVVTILMILLGVVLPLASPNVKSRKIREAARQVNAAFAGAKARAEGNGRSAGVMIYPDANASQRAYAVGYAKSPNTFRGAVDGTIATVVPQTVPDNSDLAVSFVLPDGTMDIASNMQLRRLLGIDAAVANDSSINNLNGTFLIRFNRRGRWRQCNWTWPVPGAPGGLLAFAIPFVEAIPEIEYPQHSHGTGVGSDQYTPPHPPVSNVFANNGAGACVMTNVPYEIRIPPRRSAASLITLPTGVHIDLARSVPFLTTGSAFLPPPPITVMFDKSGHPDRLYRNGGAAPILDQFGLLVVDSDVTGNVLHPDSGSMWVVVDHKTGQVKTVDNLGSDVNSDGIFDQIVVYDIEGDNVNGVDPQGPGDDVGADVDGNGVADDVNGDSFANSLDTLPIANEAISASKAGGR